jgi:hypothetical protein
MINNVEPTPDPCTVDRLIFINVDSFPRNVVANFILSMRNEIIYLIIKVRTLEIHELFISIA